MDTVDCGVIFGGAYSCSNIKGHEFDPEDEGHGDCRHCDPDKGIACARHLAEARIYTDKH